MPSCFCPPAALKLSRPRARTSGSTTPVGQAWPIPSRRKSSAREPFPASRQCHGDADQVVSLPISSAASSAAANKILNPRLANHSMRRSSSSWPESTGSPAADRSIMDAGGKFTTPLTPAFFNASATSSQHANGSIIMMAAYVWARVISETFCKPRSRQSFQSIMGKVAITSMEPFGRLRKDGA